MTTPPAASELAARRRSTKWGPSTYSTTSRMASHGMNAICGPGEYWRRRPGHRPVLSRARRGRPEREAEASTTPQIKGPAPRPAGAGLPAIGGPHAIPWTHAAQVNTALLDFIRS